MLELSWLVESVLNVEPTVLPSDISEVAIITGVESLVAADVAVILGTVVPTSMSVSR